MSLQSLLSKRHMSNGASRGRKKLWLDLAKYQQGGSAERNQFTQELLDSLTRHGFVKIVNHGISDEEVSNLFNLSRNFFHLNLEEKAECANEPGPNPQRGWSMVGAESTARLYGKGLMKREIAGDLVDAREHFDQGAAGDAKFPNKWPREDILPGFRKKMEQAFTSLESVNNILMRALENGLGLPPGSFMDRITQESSASEFRMNHFPAITVKELKGGKVSRIWPHFDLGVITLLFQDSVGGLEFEDRTSPGTFKSVECEASSDIIVNVSETLQRWTNDRLPAGLHRVNIPQDMQGSDDDIVLPERYSIAYFCKADRDASVGPLKEFVPNDTKPAYEHMTAIEYHNQRLLSAY